MIPKTDKTNSNPSNMCVVDVLMGFKHIYFVIPNANPINRTFMSLCSFELYTNSCKHEIHVVLEILIFIQWLAFLNIRQEFILRLRIHNTGQMPVNVIIFDTSRLENYKNFYQKIRRIFNFKPST